MNNTRTHCNCGTELRAVADTPANWGDWKCRRCGWRYCQDCGAPLDESDQCTAYRAEQDAEEAANCA